MPHDRVTCFAHVETPHHRYVILTLSMFDRLQQALSVAHGVLRRDDPYEVL